MTKTRSLSRHLLAMCTFLVPLGVIAWIGQRELQRQAGQVQSAVDREALQFLQGAAQALDLRFDEFVPAVEQECDRLIGTESTSATVRQLRARGFSAVLDIVWIGNDARLRHPQEGSTRMALPFHRDPWGRSDEDGARAALRRADSLIALEKFAEAESALATAAVRLADDEHHDRRRGPGESAFHAVPVWFRLATVRKKLGKRAEANEAFAQAVDRTAAQRANSRGNRTFDPSFDSEMFTLGLLAELALAEDDAGGDARLALLTAMSRGERDQLSETILYTVADRLLAGAPEAVMARAKELREDVGLHLHARTFADDYDRTLRETVLRRIRSVESTAQQSDLRPVLTAGSPSTLLLLHRAPEAVRDRAAWLGIRLDAGQILASALEPLLAGEGFFRPAIADSEDLPIVSAPRAPEDYAPPALASHGMMLRAYPTDMDGYLESARSSKTSAALLLGFLFLAASIGAVWMWRSVSRETELLALKVDLVSRVSHELKTPLSLISLYGETLAMKRARDEDQAAQFGEVITREAGRLTTLIQRILDFSRREAGTLVYEPQETDLGEALLDIAETYEPHLTAKGSTLSTDLKDGILAKVDRAAFCSAVLNLLENAAKYAREEDPAAELRIELRRNGDMAEIDVLDRGRGVPADEREAIFDSFYRANNAGEVRGAGLGLSLVRHFAEAHGGTAVALPRDGGGSIFRITVMTTPLPA